MRDMAIYLGFESHGDEGPGNPRLRSRGGDGGDRGHGCGLGRMGEGSAKSADWFLDWDG